MKKRFLMLPVIALCTVFLFSGCGKKEEAVEEPAAEAAEETAEEEEQRLDEEGNIILAESFEESGEIEEENTDEETGEILEQVEVDFNVDVQSDTLIIETSNGGVEGTWKYLISDENVISLGTEDAGEDGTMRYSFHSAAPGEASIGISFFTDGDDGIVTLEDVKDGMTDISVELTVGEDLLITLK